MRFERARQQMVQGLEEAGISDPRVLSVMATLPRERFVPEAMQSQAYSDSPLPIGERQTISQPWIVALASEALELTGAEKVLEIGVGSGYQACVLAGLARWVYGVERIGSIARTTRALLDELGYQNIILRTADGTLGWREFAPFDAIVVSAGAPSIPEPLLDQLSPGGRLVIPVGDEASQVLTRVRRVDGGFVKERLAACRFVPLIGRYGWEKMAT